jgi:lysophospholipase L1-like esterase
MGVPIEAIYPTVLAERLRARAGGRAIVLNGAVPGYSSLQAWRSLRRDLARFSPDVATLYVGWNDINPAVYFPDRSQNVWRTHARPVRAVLARSRAYRYLTTLLLAREDPGPRVGPEDFRANLLAFVADCRARAIVPVLLTVPTPTGDFAYNAIVRSVAQGTGAHCLDLAAAMPARDAMFQDDGTHPNAAGHRWIGEALAPALCEAAPALRCGG